MLAVKRLNEFRVSSSHKITGSLKLLEPSELVQSCKVVALSYYTLRDHLQWATFPISLTLLSDYLGSWSSEVISWSVWGRFADVNIAVGKKVLSVQTALHGTIPIRQCCTCITFWMMVYHCCVAGRVGIGTGRAVYLVNRHNAAPSYNNKNCLPL